MGSTAPPTATAMLFALTSPGPKVPLAEFTTWYDDDHAPSRAAVPGVLTATRFEAIDNTKPEWLAVYELENADVLSSPAYQKLWETSSDYEKDLLDRCEDLSRRVYKLISRKTKPGFEGGATPRIYHPVGLQPRPGSDMTDKEMHDWYEDEHIPLLSKVPGWLRSTRWELLDVKGANMREVDASKVSRFLAVHEWESDEVFGTKEQKTATTTEWRGRVMERIDKGAEERRQFRVWKDFPCD